MCVSFRDGEIGRIVFYGLDRADTNCRWNRQAPFALVEQGIVEPGTGARFPSFMKTIYSLDPKYDAVFEQRFEHCGFTNVEVRATYGDAQAAPGAP